LLSGGTVVSNTHSGDQLMRKTIVLGGALLLVQIPLLALTLIQSDVFGGANHDEARRVAAAPDGGVYVAGNTLSGDGDGDAFLRRYDANHVLLWERAYGLPFDPTVGFDDDFIEGLAVGADGSAYMAGMLGTGVLFLAKFDPAGNLVWDSTYGANATIATGAALDAAGNIYVSASAFSGPDDPEARLLKFNPDGTMAWARSWGGTTQFGFDPSRGLATSADGVYMIGETNSFFANDAFLVKFDFDGNLLWERTWGVDGLEAPFTGLTSAYGVTTDGAGNIYFTGATSDSGHSNNIILVKFNGAGDLLWSKVGGPGFGAGRDVAVSADGTAVFVSGNILGDDPEIGGGPAFVVEFSSAGKAKKGNTFGGIPGTAASAESVTVNAAGLVVSAGYVGEGPHEFGRASNSAKIADTHLVIPIGVVQPLPTDLLLQDGQVLSFDSVTGGGLDDAFALWMTR
jgi:hypothetical protein